MKNSDQVKEQHRPTRNIADTLSAATAFDAPAFQLEAEEEEPIQMKPDVSIQAKLTVGAPDDMYEKEADRVAEQVVSSPTVQRTDTAETKPEDEKMLQTKPMVQFKVSADGGGEEVSPDIQRQIQGAQGGGSALPQNVQGQMEGAFGTGFDNVRVHTGSQANELNESLNARAFTTGSDIFFKGGEYNPESGEGQKLLAHELTHVVQQGAATPKKGE